MKRHSCFKLDTLSIKELGLLFLIFTGICFLHAIHCHHRVEGVTLSSWDMGRNRFPRPRNQSKLCYEKIPEVCYCRHVQSLVLGDKDGSKRRRAAARKAVDLCTP